jgi:F-type H+-transporting ATPase subunit b
MQNLSFNALEFLVNLINFIVLLALFYQIVIVNLGKMIAARGRAVLARLQEVKMLRHEASLAESRRNEQLQGLGQEITEFRELTQRSTGATCERMLRDADHEAQHIVERAGREVESLQRLAQEDYQRRVTQQAVLRVEGKMADLLTQETQEDLVQNFLRKVGTLHAA